MDLTVVDEMAINNVASPRGRGEGGKGNALGSRWGAEALDFVLRIGVKTLDSVTQGSFGRRAGSRKRRGSYSSP